MRRMGAGGSSGATATPNPPLAATRLRRATLLDGSIDDGHYAKWGITSEISFVTLASTRWEKVRAAVRVRKYAIAWQEHVAELVCAPNGSGRRADLAAFVADFDAV